MIIPYVFILEFCVVPAEKTYMGFKTQFTFTF